ncbi:MAG: DUF805 domain-containing protein [Muribaculaceae bacterium]|nr:DUF805 domain-containing protein [Muribaculaceae bacterium]
MPTKEELLNNLSTFDADYIVELINEGRLSFFEVISSKQLSPEISKEVERKLSERNQSVDDATSPVEKNSTSLPKAKGDLNSNLKSILKRMFSCKGRINRVQYLLSVVLFVGILLLSGILTILFVFIFAAIGADPKNSYVNFSLYCCTTLYLIVFFADIVFLYMSAIKRFHDTNRSGWLFALLLIPFLNIIADIYFFFILFFSRGDDYVNNYGPVPEPNYKHC